MGLQRCVGKRLGIWEEICRVAETGGNFDAFQPGRREPNDDF